MIEQIPQQLDSLDDTSAQLIIFKQDAPSMAISALYDSLSQREVQRMQAYYTKRLQQYYVVRRGMLRHCLATILGKPAKDLVFSYNAYGKPFLSDEPIAFNLSHSKNLGMIGLCRTAIGVDIEAMIATDDLGAITKTHFATEEQNAWASLSTRQQLQGFYNAWTRKEAFIKIDGRGLQIPLDSFAVSLDPQQPARILWSHDVDARHWQLIDLPVPDGFAGAMVVGTQVKRIQITSSI